MTILSLTLRGIEAVNKINDILFLASLLTTVTDPTIDWHDLRHDTELTRVNNRLHRHMISVGTQPLYHIHGGVVDRR